MKTKQEIHVEAGHLMTLGTQFQDEYRLASGSANTVAMTRVLMRLPTNSVMPARERHVEAAIAGGALVFRLFERNADIPAPDGGERVTGGTLLAVGPSAYDVLSAGYEIVETERIAAALERHAERRDDRSDSKTVADVEAVLNANLLPPSDRIRTRVDVVEFLEGRLDLSALITRNLERQGSREEVCEHLVEREELKLVIGEP